MDRLIDLISLDYPASAAVLDQVSRLQRYASRRRFIACVQAGEFLLFLSFSLCWFQNLASSATDHRRLLDWIAAILVSSTICCIFHCFGLYDFGIVSCGRKAVLRTLSAGSVAFGLLLTHLLIREDIVGKRAALAYGIMTAGLTIVVLIRIGFAWLATKLQHSGIVNRRIYIIADMGAAGASLRAALEHQPDNRVIGMWNLSDQPGPIEIALEGAVQFLRVNPVDVIILKLPLTQPDRVARAARVLRTLPQVALFAPSLDAGEEIVLHPYTQKQDALGNMLLVEMSARPLAGWCWVIKDIQDRLLALVLLIATLPVMLAIMIAVKLSDPGPIFFRQKRFGYSGRTFDIIKFRSMRVAKNTLSDDSLTLTTRDDSRMFPVGSILRKTSLDELPQLLNVILGDMWIIGPRPHSPHAKAGGIIYGKAVQDYAARYRIKPGMTGWAQVSGWRGPTDTLQQLQKRVEHDLHYIENWSPVFDARILCKTLLCAFNHENAF